MVRSIYQRRLPRLKWIREYRSYHHENLSLLLLLIFRPRQHLRSCGGRRTRFYVPAKSYAIAGGDFWRAFFRAALILSNQEKYLWIIFGIPLLPPSPPIFVFVIRSFVYS